MNEQDEPFTPRPYRMEEQATKSLDGDGEKARTQADKPLQCTCGLGLSSRVMAQQHAENCPVRAELFRLQLGGSEVMREADLAEIARLRAELALVKGAMAADDERLRVAAERVGIIAGCDAPDEMADTILGLRAENDELVRNAEALRAQLHTMSDNYAGILRERDEYTRVLLVKALQDEKQRIEQAQKDVRNEKQISS